MEQIAVLTPTDGSAVRPSLGGTGKGVVDFRSENKDAPPMRVTAGDYSKIP